MTIVKHHTLIHELESIQIDHVPNLFLICGEPYFVKKSLTTLESFLVGKEKNQFSMEKLDGTVTTIGDIIEQVSTFSFLSKKKIVVVQNILLFEIPNNAPHVQYSSTEVDVFANFIEKGWPLEHVLVITSVQSDKRKKIFKTILEKGMIIDCGVAKGVRKVDLDEQRSVLQSVAGQILSKYAKTMDNQSFQTVLDLTGFNLDLFCRNIEKLSVYVGDRKQITQHDIKAVVVREKKDPIFHLTNAVMEKEIKASLFYLNSLLKEGLHPLQILKSLENLFRKLILVRDSLNHFYPNGVNLKQMSFNQFKQNLLPKIEALDLRTKEKIEKRDLFLSGKVPAKKDLPNDLFLAPNPKNAYPVYQVFQKSENFSLDELCQILLFLSDLDYNLKTSAIDTKTQIENLIIKLCSKGGFVHAQEY